jgi:2'-5' RNA ligase|uniref:RNA 2',3'-cyclic phosphodiesterase n=1 Tax=candidate division WOR-3 bacterium TaxID=2052148 RepID=A0A7C3Z2W0_UNCW3
MIRSFIAITIPEEVKREIGKIIRECEAKKYPCRWVVPENLHITLLFLGEVSEDFLARVKKELAKIAQKTKVFSIKLGGFGAFPSWKNPRIIWIGVPFGNKEIESLQANLVENLAQLGFKPEEKRFHPHLTIGRAKGLIKDIDLLERRYESDLIKVETVVLFKSTLTPNGPVYEKIEEYRLSE